MALRYHTVVRAFACLVSRPPSAATLRAIAVCSALTLECSLTACSDDARDPAVRVDRPDGQIAMHDADAGGDRPPASPILPPADDEILLPFAGSGLDYPIRVAAQPGVLDVHFSVDTSASIGAEIDQLQADLSRSIAPGLRSRVARVSFGVSRFADFPRAPFGFVGGPQQRADVVFELLTPITESLSRITSAVAKLDQPLDDGGDLPEAGAEALFQIATGNGYMFDGKTLIRQFSGEEGGGGVGFRAGALRVVLHVTDAPSHHPADYGESFPGTHSMAQASSALRAIGAKLVAIVSGSCTGQRTCDDAFYRATRVELEQVALATGAVGEAPEDGECPHGVDDNAVPAAGGQCPLVFDVDDQGRGLSDTVLDGIARLVDGIRFGQVSGQVSDDPLGFVRSVRAVEAEPLQGEVAAEIADRLPAGAPDGELDSFVDVRNKARLLFHVRLRNDRIRPSEVDQVFRAVVAIEGDGLEVERRTLRIRVPAGTSIAPEFDPSGDAGP